MCTRDPTSSATCSVNFLRSSSGASDMMSENLHVSGWFRVAASWLLELQSAQDKHETCGLTPLDNSAAAKTACSAVCAPENSVRNMILLTQGFNFPSLSITAQFQACIRATLFVATVWCDAGLEISFDSKIQTATFGQDVWNPTEPRHRFASWLCLPGSIWLYIKTSLVEQVWSSTAAHIKNGLVGWGVLLMNCCIKQVLRRKTWGWTILCVLFETPPTPLPLLLNWIVCLPARAQDGFNGRISTQKLKLKYHQLHNAKTSGLSIFSASGKNTICKYKLKETCEGGERKPARVFSVKPARKMISNIDYPIISHLSNMPTFFWAKTRQIRGADTPRGRNVPGKEAGQRQTKWHTVWCAISICHTWPRR